MNRRAFLRSTAAASSAVLGLPWFESIAGAATAIPPQRFAIYYVPIGVVRSSFFPGESKIAIPKFQGPNTPQVESKFKKVGEHDLPFTPTIEPLKSMKEKITLITGMDRKFQNGTDVHAQCASCFLSSAAPYTIKSSAWPLDRTLDHIIGDHIGGTSPYRTLEFSCNNHKDNKESIYFDNISWYGTGHVAPSMRNPRAAYRRLFGTSESRRSRNITDLVLDDAKSLRGELGAADQHKFAEYLDAVRTIEQRMERLEAMKAELSEVKLAEPPAAYLPRGEYIRLMGDLMVVALQTGLTRVATLMIGPERWDTPFTYESLFEKPMSHHQMSHNQKRFSKQLAELDHFHMEQFAYTLQRMDAIEEANGTTLLDNTMLTYGSGLGDGATHQYNDLPIIVAGGGKRRSAGKHIHLPDRTPLANLWLTQARQFGIKRDRFADSTKELTGLF